MTVTLKIEKTHLSDMVGKFRSVEPDLHRKYGRQMVKKALEPVKQAAELRAPDGPSGNLKRAFKTTSSTRGAEIKSEVFPDPKIAPHAHLVEFGHRNVGHKPDKKDLGSRTPEHPFLRPAFDSRLSEMEVILADEIGTFLDQHFGR